MLYLYVDLCAFIVPFLFSFHPAIRFYRHWSGALPAILFSAIPFLVWDSYFTTLGVWGFNKEYLSGIYLYNLPLEEVLFFFCIPYSCLFTYYCFSRLSKKQYFLKAAKWITSILAVTLMIAGFLFINRQYTASTFISLLILLVLLQYAGKVKWLHHFYFTYLVLLIPFTIVNGILTGYGLDKPVVWYNNAENTGLRMGTIPVEDIFYGMMLILLNVSVFEYFKYKNMQVRGVSALIHAFSKNRTANL